MPQEGVEIVGSAVGLHAVDAASRVGLLEAEVDEAGEDLAREVGVFGGA